MFLGEKYGLYPNLWSIIGQAQKKFSFFVATNLELKFGQDLVWWGTCMSSALLYLVGFLWSYME